jgi:hypothetical protein
MAKEQVTVSDQLIDLVGKAKAEDLSAMDQTIADKEKEIVSLRAMRRVIALALGVETDGRLNKKPKGAAKPVGAPAAPASSTTEERRALCVKHIAKNGPTVGATLCQLFDIPTGSQTTVLTHEWFERSDRGFALTAKGNDAARRLAAGGG